MVSTRQGLGVKLAVEAKIEIPERGLTAYLSIAPQDDTPLSTSYIARVLSALQPNFHHEGIASLEGVFMKFQESSKGVRLVGYPKKASSNDFLYTLSSIESKKQANLTLLKERTWFDIAITYDDGERGIVALEKGAYGEGAFSALTLPSSIK
jgi:hypothetical protein